VNKYAIIGLFVFWLSSIAGTAYFVHDYTKAKTDQDKLSSVERTIEQQNELDEQNRELEFSAAEQKEKIRIVYRDRIKKVTEYVESTNRIQCFDDSGVQLYNSISAMEDASGYAVR
jgi:hypothetical protein